MKGLTLFCVLVCALEVTAGYNGKCKFQSIDSIDDEYRDQSGRQPNIVYIMADDLGWNDVGFHNPKVKTPHLNALKAKGIELTQSYVERACSPTRSALMTGRYPSNNGLHVLVVLSEAQTCLPIEHKTIYQYMKEEGYVTKHLGKWHLGYCNEACLPGSRGVDEFRGINTGAADYYNWTDGTVMQRQINGIPSTENIGTHMALQDARDVREMILDHRDNPKPLFMWVTPTAPHDPLQNTDEMFAVHDFLNSTDDDARQRRIYLGLVSAFDDIVGATVDALKEAGMDNNTIIVFSSDNGGPDPSGGFPNTDKHLYASNYPLRNGKETYMEGGVRVPTIYYDPRLHPRTRGKKRSFLVHVTDWLPTFLGLARPGQTNDTEIPDIDGVSQLANLGSIYNCARERRYNKREEMLVALSDAGTNFRNPSQCGTEDAAYRWRNYKLFYGEQYYLVEPGLRSSNWPLPEESPELPEITGDDCHRMVNGTRVVRCLFDVINDPSETTNLYDDKPIVVARIVQMIEAAKRASVKPVFNPKLPADNFTTQAFGEYIVPRHDYCDPSVHFPLEPNDPSCYE
ncbi:arylsulfatase B-like [Watersipora subatra]|uniref:arylsulfatase B-like n=1 Tax=Watersipora subatra TaxID=2589382 RepID=UPI00355B17B0